MHINYCTAGKFGGGKFSEFGESSAICQTKTIKLVFTINNLLADLLICQTFFHQTLKKSQFTKLFPCQTFLLYGTRLYYVVGRSFIFKLDEESWPTLQEIKPSDVIYAELTKSGHSETHVLTSIGGQATFNMDNVINYQKFTEFKLLLRVTTHVLHFVEIVKGSPLRVFDLIHGHNQLEARELDQAETLWIWSIQFQAFER